MLTLIKKLSKEEADFSTEKLKPNEEDYASTERKGVKGIKKSDMFFCIFFSCCILALALVLIFKPPVSPELDESDGEKWQGKQAIEHQAEVKHIEIPGIDRMYFKAGETTQKVNIYNPESNDCTISYKLIMKGKVIWKSEKCYPGYGFYEIKLTHSLEAGTYNAHLLHVCERDGQQLNSANMNVEIIVD